MATRGKLIDLIKETPFVDFSSEAPGRVADHLLANGVTLCHPSLFYYQMPRKNGKKFLSKRVVLCQIVSAISTHLAHAAPIPQEWVDTYNELVKEVVVK